MKTRIAAVLICFTLASACSAAPLPKSNPRVTAIGNINQLRQIKFPYAAVKVLQGKVPAVQAGMPSLQDSSSSTAQANTEGSPLYRTGSGVVLRPAKLRDPQTGSSALIFYMLAHNDALDAIKNDPNAVMPVCFTLIRDRDTRIMETAFGSLPSGLHSYMLTMSLESLGRPLDEHLYLYIGGEKFDATRLVINPNTGEARALFAYDAGANSANGVLYVTAFWSNGNESGSQNMNFRYIQLVQLD